MLTENDTLGWMRNAHGGREAQTRTEKGILVFRRALKLLERAHVKLRRAYGGVKKDTLVVEEGTCGLKRIDLHSDGWKIRMGAQHRKRGQKMASSELEGHSNCLVRHMWRLEGHIEC